MYDIEIHLERNVAGTRDFVSALSYLGLMYWYLRGMGELQSVEDFLLKRERRFHDAPPQD
jgi:hypothetical protein